MRKAITSAIEAGAQLDLFGLDEIALHGHARLHDEAATTASCEIQSPTELIVPTETPAQSVLPPAAPPLAVDSVSDRPRPLDVPGTKAPAPALAAERPGGATLDGFATHLAELAARYAAQVPDSDAGEPGAGELPDSPLDSAVCSG